MKFASGGMLAFLLLAGCSKNIDTTEAVKQGVVKDVSKNVNVGAMDVNVLSVHFRGKEADAVVAFAPKGGSPREGLTMNYTLERQGDEWRITNRAQSDMQKHAGQAAPGAMPPGHPPTDGTPESGGQNLPPGHPPLKQ